MSASIAPPVVNRSPVAHILRDRWLTLFGILVAAFTFVMPSIAGWMEYTRAQSTQAWRFFTCHWTHFDVNHLLWSGSMFVLLAAMLERRGRRRLMLCIVTSALAVSVAVHFAAPGVATYRGLSGIDSALFALLLLDLFREARVAGDRRAIWLHTALGLAFSAKLVFEVWTGGSVFVSAEAYDSVPLAHFVGAASGAGLGATRKPNSG